MKFILVLGLLILMPVLWLRGGLFQEPVTTALLAARLEIFRENWRDIAGSGEVILRAKDLENYLHSQEKNGWRYSEQLGSGYQFVRSDQRDMITCRLYSSRYRICETLGNHSNKTAG